MPYLQLFKYGLKFMSAIAQILHDRGMMQAGANALIIESLENATKEVDNAIFAGKYAAERFDDLNGLPNDEDPNLRD